MCEFAEVILVALSCECDGKDRERVREGETDRHIQRQRETEREREIFHREIRFFCHGTKATSSVYNKTDAWNAFRIRMAYHQLQRFYG